MRQASPLRQLEAPAVSSEAWLVAWLAVWWVTSPTQADVLVAPNRRHSHTPSQVLERESCMCFHLLGEQVALAGSDCWAAWRPRADVREAPSRRRQRRSNPRPADRWCTRLP